MENSDKMIYKNRPVGQFINRSQPELPLLLNGLCMLRLRCTKDDHGEYSGENTTHVPSSMEAPAAVT